jgi:hypothetical protein
MGDINASIGKDQRLDSVNISPVTARLTVTSSVSVLAAAGASDATGRKRLRIRNLDDSIQIRYGASSASAIYQLGTPIEPGETVIIDFPNSSFSVYLRSQGYAVETEVTES